VEDKIVIEELSAEGYDRRELLKRAAVAGVGLSALGTLGVQAASAGSGQKLDTVRWVSPRGTLEVMDDYNLVVPIRMGYFKRLGIDAKLLAGDASGNLAQIAAGSMDMGYASPGVLTASIDAGVPVVSIWEQYPAQVFNFVLPADSKISHPRQLKGKSISVFTIGWKPIIDPLLAEVGVDPKSVKIKEFGAQWNQAVALKLVDAGLSWEGLRAQLDGMAAIFGTGFNFKHLIGSQWSIGPSNSYQVRTSDMEDADKVDIYTRFLAGVVMGFEFARVNPRAAAQITYEQYAGLQKVITPQVALDSMMQLASGYGASRRRTGLWGFHFPGAWTKYLNSIAKLGQTKQQLTLADVLTNDVVRPANAGANKSLARRDAAKFKLSAAFKATTVPKGLPL
jgi:NitT/TauT family transport system substrate-binding protein